MPKTFVVVGDTDWWSVGDRHVDVALDSRLRSVTRIPGGSSGVYPTIVGTGRRYPQLAQRFYAEYALATGTNGGDGVGIVGDSAVAAVIGSYIGGPAASVAYYQGGIYKGGTAIQTGLAASSSAERVGVELYRTDAGVYAQLWLVSGPQSAVALGTPVSLSAEHYRLCATIYYETNQISLYTDAGELWFLPVAAQPWGAAAQVACSSGTTPAASRLIPGHAALIVDPVGRTVRSSDNSTVGRIVTADSAPKRADDSALYYFEWPWEAAGLGSTANQYCVAGVALRSTTTATYVGGTSASWGYYGENASVGQKYHNASPTTVTGSAYGPAHIAGAIWQPATGKLWFTREGLPIEGNPEAGTGASYTGVFGDIVPAICPYNGRVRLATQAREQRKRPSYCVPWDGADLLREQHFQGRLLPRSSVARGLQFALRGNAPQRTAVGSVAIGNGAGQFDRLADWMLRNQAVVGYYIDDTYSDREFTGVVDSIKRGGFAELEVRVGDTTSPLDVRIDAPICIVGEVARAPLIARQGTDLIFDVAPTALYAFSNLAFNAAPVIEDGGLPVDTWARVPTTTNDPTAHPGAVKRTTKPIYRQSVTRLRQFSIDGDITGLNFNLNAWTGNTPNNWTKTEAGVAGIFSAAGATAARIQGSGTLTSYAAIHQGALTHPHGGSEFDGQIVVGLHVTTNTSGDLQVALEEFTGAYPAGGLGTFVVTLAKIAGGGTGWFWVPLPTFSGVSLSFLSIYSARSGGTVDITITEVRVLQCSAYRFPDVPGVVFATNPDRTGQLRCSGEPAPISYWSDERPTRRRLLAIEHDSTLADWFSDAYGRVLTAYLTEPEAVLTTDACYIGDILEADVAGEIQDDDEGFPALSDLAWNAANFAVHSDTDIAAAVASADRAVLLAEAQQHRLAVPGAGAAEAKAFHPFYAHAVGAPPWQRYVGPLLSTSPNPAFAGTDKDLIRLHRIAALRRRSFNLPLKAAFLRAREVRPGCVATLYHRRFGLAAGKRVQFLSAPPALIATSVVCKVIG